MNVETLWCVYSPLIPPQEFSRDDALSFHSVLKAAFEQETIIPFRFPTILQNESELQAHLRAKYDLYSAELRRLKDTVQMELRITGKPEAASEFTGTEYLRSKQQQSRTLQVDSEKARSALGELVLEWKERPADQGLRCYALVRRSDLPDFQQRLAGVQPGGSTTFFLSGPWPPSEFLHD